MIVLNPQDRFLAPLEEHDKIPYKVASSYCRDFLKRLSLSPGRSIWQCDLASSGATY